MNDTKQRQEDLFPVAAASSSKAPLAGTDPATQDQHLHALLQHLILPRALMSPEDAMYAPRFLHLLHQLDAPGFPSLRCFDVLVRALAPLVFSATDQEVGFIGVVW